MKEKLIIYISKHENFLNGAEKIKNECDFTVKILYIENYKKHINLINDNDVIFFLCNDNKIQKLIDLVKFKKCYIINKVFYLQTHDKMHIQNVLMENNIDVPTIYYPICLDKIHYPIICKQNTHAKYVFLAYNQVTLEEFFKRQNIENFYLEDVVLKKRKNDIEVKFYVVKNKVFMRNIPLVFENKIRGVVRNINNTSIGLEVYSSDIIFNMDKNYIIDINPSPGFFKTDEGRSELILYIKKLLSGKEN